MQNPIQRMLTEAEAELSHTKRWSYWKPVIEAAWSEHDRLIAMLHAALDDDWENPELVAYRTARSGWKPSMSMIHEVTVPLCITCRYCHHNTLGGEYCRRKQKPAGVSPVDGTPRFRGETPLCSSERECSLIDRLWRCGPSGRFHEPKSQPEWGCPKPPRNVN